MMKETVKRRVFVVGAHMPTGGGNMVYHLGTILNRYWGYEPVNVAINAQTEVQSVWKYDTSFRTIGLSEMHNSAKKQDILIANPSYSNHLFGLSFPGNKLMYVQGYNTFVVLDGFFDKYVAVSPFVQKFLSDIYALNVPVIPPFVHHEHIPKHLLPWKERPEGSVLTMLKWQGNHLLKCFKTEVVKRFPDLKYSLRIIQKGMPHHEVLKEMSRHRYFLWLSQLEGFGLPPLEAMMCGCTVVGFHTGGGLSYFQHGHNALVHPYPNMADLVDSFHTLVADPQLATEIARTAMSAAVPFTYNRFLENWLSELTSFLGPPTEHSSKWIGTPSS